MKMIRAVLVLSFCLALVECGHESVSPHSQISSHHYDNHVDDHEEEPAHLAAGHSEDDHLAYAHPSQVVHAPVRLHKAEVYETPVVHYKPQPYSFGYKIKDDGHHHGAGEQWRHEQGDEYGTKRGSYGYRDAFGIYRQVDYVADALGFRATIKTNEPGTSNQNPAAVSMHAEPSPYQELPAPKASVVKEIPYKAYAEPIAEVVKTPVYHSVQALPEQEYVDYGYEGGYGGYGGRHGGYGTRRLHQGIHRGQGAIFVSKLH